jgi:hypothetical protein
MRKSFASGLHGEWSEFADECIGLISPFEKELLWLASETVCRG